MKYIYNITFVVDTIHLQVLIENIISVFKPEATNRPDCGFLHLARVAPEYLRANPTEEGQAASVAMQLAFPDKDSMTEWMDRDLPQSYVALEESFGKEVLHFDTVLELLDW